MYIRTGKRSALWPQQYGLGDAAVCAPDAATNGRLCSFNSLNGGKTTAVYVPDAARGANRLNLLVWIHGLPVCDGEGPNAISYLKSKPFPLTRLIADSKQPFVLVVPTMEWNKWPNSHPLGSPQKMNAFLEEVRAGLTAMGWSSPPSFGRLILAGHSKAYAVLNGLAARVNDPESSRGALATLSDVWLFDSTYGKSAKEAIGEMWLKWAKAKSNVNLRILYRKYTDTAAVAERIREKAAQAGLKNVTFEDFEPRALSHCAMPRVRLPYLLAGAGGRAPSSAGSRAPRPTLSPAPSAPAPIAQPSNGALSQRIQNALASGQWNVALGLAVMSGNRDVNKLTNMIFFARNPKLKGRKLAPADPNFKQFSREWLDIRDRTVRPFLDKQKATRPVDPKSSAPAESAPASPALSSSTLSDAARAWLAARDASSRARYESAVRTWIRSTDRSGIELLPDTSQRRLFLEQVNWSREYFPGNQLESEPGGGRQAEALFNAMARVIPERRVPQMIRYRDVDHIVRDVPNNPGAKLYPEARDAFVRMRDAAAAEGIRLVINSAWRSAERQRKLASGQTNRLAVAGTRSAHMYGLAVDLRLSAPGVSVREGNTRSCDEKTNVCEHMANIVRMYRSPVYKWMALHAREFGWFPYRREPWHWEYNPPGLAQRFESGA
jgi:hypothetical protein